MRRFIQSALMAALLIPAACTSQSGCSSQEAKPTDDVQVAEAPEVTPTPTETEWLPGELRIIYLDGTYDIFGVNQSDTPARPVRNLALFFSHDSASLDDRDRAQLERIHTWLKANPEVTLIIEGHASKPGDPDYNESLSQARAMAARRHLMALGIEEDRVELRARGEEAAGDRAASPAADRRVEFKAEGAEGSTTAPAAK